MKFQPDTLDGANLIARLEPGRVWVHQTAFDTSVLVPWRGEVQAWAPRAPSDITAETLAPVLALAPEVLLLGTGAAQVFLTPAIYRALIAARIGVELMDTAAACRTFNVLASEGRKAAAALVVAEP